MLVFSFLLISFAASPHHVDSSLQLSDNLVLRINDYLAELMTDPYYHQPALKSEVEKLFQEYRDYVRKHDQLDDRQSTPNSTVEFPVETFEDFMTVPAPFPAAIQLFTIPDSSHIHTVSLEVNGDPQITELMEMVLRKYDEVQESWIVSDSMFVRNGAQLEIKNIDGYPFIFLSAHNIAREQQLSIYLISYSKFLLHQTLRIGRIDHFTVWNEPNNNDFYLGIVSNVYDDQISCSLYFYQWANDNFALFDIIPTLCATAVKSFCIDSTLFLAVCHPSDVTNKLGTATHTTLYKFDVESKSLHIHQRIPVSDCVNIEYFEFKSSTDLITEHFIVFVYKDEAAQESTTSMVYKLHNEYFYPFQMLDVSDFYQWLTFEFSDRSFLLAASRYSGVRVFCYDGRVFVKTSIFLESTFINHISKCSVDDWTLLVIADRGNDGTHPNVFQIPYTNDDLLDEMEDVFNEWHTEVAHQLERLSELDSLEEIIDRALRVDSPEIIVNGTLEITTLDSDSLFLVQPSQDSENDTKEEEFAEALEDKLAELKMIENFVLKLVSSNGKFIVNGDLFLNDFAVNCTEECDLNILSISNLNGEDFDDLVGSTINIDTPNSFDASFDFENIAVSLHLLPEFINGHHISSLVHRKRDVLFRNGLKLNSLVISEKLNVKGLIDGVRMEPDSVLLVSGDQILNGTLLFEKGNIDKLYYHNALMTNSDLCFGHDHH